MSVQRHAPASCISIDQFSLGYSAIQVNEELPAFLISQLENRYNLREMTAGLLGMAFKANNDDTRSSLSYKLKKLRTTAPIAC